MVTYLRRFQQVAKERSGPALFRSDLVFRKHLSPVDVYCYLRARFGEPNGFQSHLRRKETSDNLVHWDFNLKAGDEDVYVAGGNREIHFMVSEKLNHGDWVRLVSTLRADFGRVGKEKGEVLKGLERWVIFPNRYVQTGDLCAALHAGISSTLKRSSAIQVSRMTPSQFRTSLYSDSRNLVRITTKLFRECLELSLLTPVLAEAFLNMTVLILCKKKIRDNPRQFEAFVKSQIDVKVFDLPYKCNGFIRPIDSNSPEYKAFKRVMDLRNDTIHGNVDPEKEKIETVYFEGTRPLFKEPGDHLLKRFQALQRQLDPEAVLKNYEAVLAFLASIPGNLAPRAQDRFWQIVESTVPGYDLDRKIVSKVLPDVTISTYMQGARYDDELAADWP